MPAKSSPCLSPYHNSWATRRQRTSGCSPILLMIRTHSTFTGFPSGSASTSSRVTYSYTPIFLSRPNSLPPFLDQLWIRALTSLLGVAPQVGDPMADLLSPSFTHSIHLQRTSPDVDLHRPRRNSQRDPTCIPPSSVAGGVCVPIFHHKRSASAGADLPHNVVPDDAVEPRLGTPPAPPPPPAHHHHPHHLHLPPHGLAPRVVSCSVHASARLGLIRTGVRDTDLDRSNRGRGRGLGNELRPSPPSAMSLLFPPLSSLLLAFFLPSCAPASLLLNASFVFSRSC